MFLDYKRLTEAGFHIKNAKDGLHIHLQGEDWPESVREAINHISREMNLSGRDEDELTDWIGDTHTWNALREATK